MYACVADQTSRAYSRYLYRSHQVWIPRLRAGASWRIEGVQDHGQEVDEQLKNCACPILLSQHTFVDITKRRSCGTLSLLNVRETGIS